MPSAEPSRRSKRPSGVVVASRADRCRTRPGCRARAPCRDADERALPLEPTHDGRRERRAPLADPGGSPRRAEMIRDGAAKRQASSGKGLRRRPRPDRGRGRGARGAERGALLGARLRNGKSQARDEGLASECAHQGPADEPWTIWHGAGSARSGTRRRTGSRGRGTPTGERWRNRNEIRDTQFQTRRSSP